MAAFLRVAQYFVILVVILSVAAFVVFAATVVLFCDHGPVSACVRTAVLLLCAPAAQIACVVMATRFRKRGQRLGLAALLYFLAVVPALGACIEIAGTP